MAFVGQTLAVSEMHRHENSESSVTAMDHSHHGMNHDSASIHSAGENPAIEMSDADMDCCDQQCDCSMANCSTLFVAIANSWLFQIDKNTPNELFKTSLMTSFVPSLLRPPISQSI